MENHSHFSDFDMQFKSDLTFHLDRIATAQEKLLAIAEEARRERTSLSEQMKKAFSRPLEEPK